MNEIKVPEKLCINCKYIATNGSHDEEKYQCLHDNNKKGYSLVTGKPIYENNFCSIQRSYGPSEKFCTADGNWFVQKEIVKTEDYMLSNINGVIRLTKKTEKYSADNL